MHRTIALLGILFLASAGWAQDKWPKALVQEVKDLNLTEATLDQIDAALAPQRESIARAETEIALRKAQLAKVLLEDKPDRQEIWRLVKESLDFEATVRLAQIDRQLVLRDKLGERGWKALNKALKQYREWRRDQPQGYHPNSEKLIGRIADLFDELAP